MGCLMFSYQSGKGEASRGDGQQQQHRQSVTGSEEDEAGKGWKVEAREEAATVRKVVEWTV